MNGAPETRWQQCTPPRYAAAVEGFVKRRRWPEPGSIPGVLDSFRKELRFYQFIAPQVGVRVPACYQAAEDSEGTLLVLEDLSDWRAGADPVEAARVLALLHRRWEAEAARRWPWLASAGLADDLVARLFEQTWPQLAVRGDLTPAVRSAGERLAGRVRAAERAVTAAGASTMIHGDASALNMRTSVAGEIALLDWEDVTLAPGVYDLAWLLVSSVEPAQWTAVIAAYGPADGLISVLPSAIVQGLFSLSDSAEAAPEAAAWLERLEEAWLRLAAIG